MAEERTTDAPIADLLARLSAAERRAADSERELAALRRSDARLRALVTASSSSIYRMSPDWRILYQLDSNTLATTAEPVTDWIERYLLDEDVGMVRAAVDRAIATRSLYELEHRVRRADGGVIWVVSRAVPLFDAAGEIVEWFGAGIDTTERHDAATRLRDAEAGVRDALQRDVRERTAELEAGRDLLRATMDSSLDMIQVFESIRDDTGAIIDFRWVLNNHTSESRYGEVRGERLLERNPGVIREGIFDAFRRVTDSGIPEQAERHYVHEQFDGWFLQSVVRLNDGVATTTKDISDWKSAQAEILALQDRIAQARIDESEARLVAVFAALPVGVHVADATGRAIFTNAELHRFLPNGILPSRDSDQGWRWRAWDADGAPIPPAGFPGARALCGETVMPGLEMLFTDAAGRDIWTSVTSTPIRDAEGAVVGQVSVISDVDALKRNAEALAASQERLRQFGEATQDVLWMRDAETLQWRYLTPAFETIYGVERAQAMAGNNFRTWLRLVVPEDRAAAVRHTRRVRRGELVRFDYRIRRPSDGAIRWLRDTDFPITDAAGRVVMIGGIGQDVTEAKLARERVEQSEERLQAAAEVGQLGLWDWDLRTDTIHWSDEHFRMEGYQPGEVTPSYEVWAARLHPDDRAATEGALRAAMAGHWAYVHEFRVVRPDGTVRWHAARGRFFYDEAGQPIRMIGAMLDTTERRDWEERQKILLAELQHRVRNILAVMRSIISRSYDAERTAEDYVQHLEGRISALARTQVQLTRHPGAGVDLEDMIRDELVAQATREAQFALDGPDVDLAPKAAEVLSLAIHELATNATKFGAFSCTAGHLDVRWGVERRGAERWLVLDWVESGVPVIDLTPRRQGFGSELIVRRIPYELKGEGTFRLQPGGLVCRIACPLRTAGSILQTDGMDG